MLRSIFKSLNRRRYLCLRLLFLANTAAILGAYFKINGNPNADILLTFSIILMGTGLAGILSKWAEGWPDK
ncbi:hypothetical protein SAMN04488104_104617 [Algoriphagus faecimaris]|uniref:Uncharacterized protein n=1 Tax=Algoriphagus faecimaris TaxID=686796 RepID=A0A1G6WR40_9BACT|nr:hypothetical protein [Algoriphagus faecimaris]SDD67505.1 hypothetical protein SAMN04488104_104617 [Algoriphagus faecimaris]